MREIEMEKLIELYRYKWFEASSKYEFNFKHSNLREKIKNEKKFDSVIENIMNKFESFPNEEADRVNWKKDFYLSIQSIVKSFGLVKDNNVSDEMIDKFLDVSRQFILECRKFDEKLSFEDIGQALRNQWIICFLQIVKNEEIKFSKSALAYSLLYPYTDNYLDDPKISVNEKECFNESFTKRLSGEWVEAKTKNEEKIWMLVSFIEDEFDRERYPSVYKGLLLIHGGQIKSLNQQEEKTIPYERDILGISLEKGGSSVLADGYLINGELTSVEEEFMFGYGFILQLADDIADVEEDLKNTHMTMASTLAGNYPLDNISNKALNFMKDLINDNEELLVNKGMNFSQLLEDGISSLVIQSIASSEKYYSKAYISEIKSGYALRFSYVKDMYKRMYRKFYGISNKISKEKFDEMIDYILEEF